jgi:hypothetical protein
VPDTAQDRRAELDELLRAEREAQGLNAEPPDALLERIGRELGPFLT